MKRGTFKYYLITFLMVFGFMAVLMVISHIRGTYLVSSYITAKGVWANEFSIFLYKSRTFILGLYLLDILALVLFPVVFTGIFVLIDLAMGRLRTKKNAKKIDEKENYDKFVDSIGLDLSKTGKFNVEDFRHFRSNQKFQACLKTLYEIYSNGENEEKNYIHLLRKFDKGTKEKQAIEYLVAFTEKRRKELESKKENTEEVSQ